MVINNVFLYAYYFSFFIFPPIPTPFLSSFPCIFLFISHVFPFQAHFFVFTCKEINLIINKLRWCKNALSSCVMIFHLQGDYMSAKTRKLDEQFAVKPADR